MPRPESRRKIHKDESPKEVKLAGNGPDPSDVLVYTRKIKDALKAHRATGKRLTLIKRLAKNQGLDIGFLMQAIANQERDPAIVREEFLKQLFYNQTLQTIPKVAGEQLGLFEYTPKSSIPTPAELAEVARNKGFYDGISGLDWDDQAYPMGHEFRQSYMDGWNAGEGYYKDKGSPIDEKLTEDQKPKAEAAPAPEADPVSAED